MVVLQLVMMTMIGLEKVVAVAVTATVGGGRWEV